jgi:hypothetical protein
VVEVPAVEAPILTGDLPRVGRLIRLR